MNLLSAKKLFHNRLDSIIDTKEVNAIFYFIVNQYFKIKNHELYINENILSTHDEKFLESALKRLEHREPIQYILNKTVFYNLDFALNNTVLIPRPETEELVDIIIRENKEAKNVSILDIGTGSGIIAISLSKALYGSEVSAIDISKNALLISKKNAQKHDVKINFICFDILKNSGNKFKTKWDIIVSNPPYIPVKEKNNLSKTVVDFEPHNALFVPDDDPLIFYRKIVEFSDMHLKKCGKLYFETYEQFHMEILSLLDNNGYFECRSIKDINNKNRFITAIKKGN